MKRLIPLLLALSLILCSCSANSATQKISVTDKIKSLDSVQAHVYDGGLSYDVPVSDTLIDLLGGEWTECNRPKKPEKIIYISLGNQYEVCFFEDGLVMVYYGFCSLFETDKAYYKIPDETAKQLCEYIIANGTQVNDNETRNPNTRNTNTF